MSASAQVAAPLEGTGGGGTLPGTGSATVGGGRRRALSHTNTNFPKKYGKHDSVHSHKHGRKRLQSLLGDRGKFHIPHKKRRKDGHIVPPTKFLLGGNICDPLNLGSLQDEEINRAMNAVTPKSSPLPTPKHRKGEVEVIIPPNINDPLNLNSCEDDEEYAAQLANSGGSPLKKTRSKNKRKKKRLSTVSSSCGKEEVADVSVSSNTGIKTDSTESVSDLVTNNGSQAAQGESCVVPAPIVPAESAALEGGAAAEAATPEAAKTQESPIKKSNRRSDEWAKDRRPRKVDLKDKIVSPVIWQPGQKPLYLHGHGGHTHSYGRNRSFKGKKTHVNQQQEPKFKPKDAVFQYGNFNRYYGYRNSAHEPDVRLKIFAEHMELFRDKDVLDIGCNVGHITLSVGRDFRARSVVGIDIDRKLIDIARKNVRHYVNCEQSPAPTAPGTPSSTPSHATPSYTPSYGLHAVQASSQGLAIKQRSPHDRFFPISMPIVFGPVEIPGITDGIRTPKSTTTPLPFPKNISFVQGNYVPDSDTLLALEQPQFDVVLCLSITKWFHLNWGDSGLKRAFRRMYAQLRSGGCLILEYQAWPSYARKKKLTETIWKNYQSIEFFPNQFRDYLLSPEVGFSHCRVLGISQHPSKGFRRPIIVFTKGDASPAFSADGALVLPSTVYAQTTSATASPASIHSPCVSSQTPEGVKTCPRGASPSANDRTE